MKPALSYHSTTIPRAWQQLPQGELMAQALERQLSQWWPKIFGYHLLKVGSLSCALDTSACAIKHQINLTEQVEQASVVADPDALPFLEQSIDAVLLSHCLEFYPDPHHIVRETHRVLMPDGYLLLSGYNPVSSAGLVKLWPGVKQQLPWSGRFFTPSRVKDWLHLLGFEVMFEQRFFCSSLLGTHTPESGWQRWCDTYLGYFGASYLLVARKRVLPLTPIRPKWQRAPAFQASVKGISARQGFYRD